MKNGSLRLIYIGCGPLMIKKPGHFEPTLDLTIVLLHLLLLSTRKTEGGLIEVYMVELEAS